MFGESVNQKELFSTGSKGVSTARENALAIIKQVAGDDVAVRFADKIIVPPNHVNMAKWAGLASGEAAGGANKIDRLITISLDPDFETDNTAYHEAYHLIEDLKTKAERDLIRRELPRLRKIVAEDMRVLPEEVADIAPSEIEAQAFAAYAQGKAKGLHVGIRGFFAKLLKIIRRIRNMMQGLGYKTVDDYFDSALRGEVQARGLEGEQGEGEQFSPGKRREPAFYSAVVRSVENAKITKGTPDQWMGYLKNQPGVKADELAWLNVDDWLKEQGGSVTKEALLDFVRANQVEVKEVQLGADPNASKVAALREQSDQAHEAAFNATEAFSNAVRASGLKSDTYPVSSNMYEWKDEQGQARLAEAGLLPAYKNWESAWDRVAQIKEEIKDNVVETKEPKFASYQLPGGENYRELLLTLPEREGGERGPKGWGDTAGGTHDTVNFRGSHWDEPNVLAHVRFNEREVNGKRVLFIEEVQSDWHQKGRRQGYGETRTRIPVNETSDWAIEQDRGFWYWHATLPDGQRVSVGRGYSAKDDVDPLDETKRAADDSGGVYIPGAATNRNVPDAPFKTTWPELAMKRMIRWGAENGFDEVAWTPGDVQAERYDLSKQVDAVRASKTPSGKFQISVKRKDGTAFEAVGVKEASELPDVVGKDLADRIIKDSEDNQKTWGVKNRRSGNWSQRFATKGEVEAYREALPPSVREQTDVLEMTQKQSIDYTGLDLKVGGTGMIGFYDRILPSVANKLGKKFGAKVGTTDIHDKSVSKFDLVRVGGAWRLVDRRTANGAFVGPSFRSGGDAEAWLEEQRLSNITVHSLPITPAMREAAMQGQPLFSIGRRPRRDPNAFFDTPEDRRRLREFLAITSLGMLRRGVNTTLLRRRLQDRAISMRDMLDAIKAAGGTISENADLYLGESLYYGRAGERIFDLRTRSVDPLVEKMQAFGIDRADFDEFLYALHAPERNAAIRQRDPQNTEGSGMSDAEARAIVGRRFSGNQAQHYRELAVDVQRIVKRARETLFNAGLISQETLDAWNNAYRFYVPLRGWEGEDIDEGPRSGRGFDVRGPEAHAATGRHSRADSPLAYTLMQAQQAIIRAEKNRVAQMLGRLAVRYPNKQVWEVNKVELKKRINPSTGLVEEYWLNPQAQPKENIVIAKSRGKATYITVHHEGLLNAMRMSGPESMGKFLAAVGRFTRFVASLYTTFDPDFLLRNLTRDTQEAMLHLSEQRRRGLRRQVLRDMPAASAGMFRYLRGDQSNSSAWLRNAREFAQAGGKISFFNQESLEDQKRALDRALSVQSPITAFAHGRPDKAALAAFHAVGGFIEDINGAAENAIRLSIYVNLRRAGVSQSQAASAAREITVNFNRKGEWSSAINVLYLFSNATVQGGFRQAQLAKRAPRTFLKAAMAMAVLGAGADWLNYLLAGEDPKDGVNFWDKVPEYDRQRNFIIMQPGTGKYLFKLPMFYGYNIWPTLGASIFAAIRHEAGQGNGMEPIDAALNVMSSVANAYSPLDLATGLQALVPTVLSPLVEIWRNKDWKGAPITPPKSDDKQPNADLFYRGVNPLSKEVAKTLEKYTTYDARKPPAIDISPEWIDHIWNSYMGGAGQFWVERVAGNLAKLVQGEPIDTKDIPFFRTFRGEVGEYVNTNVYYNLSDDVLRIKQLMESAPSEADRSAVRAEYPVEAAVVGDFVVADKILGKLRRARKHVEGNPDLSAQERQSEVQKIEAEMSAVRDRARAAWEAQRKRIRG